MLVFPKLRKISKVRSKILLFGSRFIRAAQARFHLKGFFFYFLAQTQKSTIPTSISGNPNIIGNWFRKLKNLSRTRHHSGIYNKKGQIEEIYFYSLHPDSIVFHLIVCLLATRWCQYVVVTFYKTKKNIRNMLRAEYLQTSHLKWGTLPYCVVCHVTGWAVWSFSCVPVKYLQLLVCINCSWSPSFGSYNTKNVCLNLVFSSRISVLFLFVVTSLTSLCPSLFPHLLFFSFLSLASCCA